MKDIFRLKRSVIFSILIFAGFLLLQKIIIEFTFEYYIAYCIIFFSLFITFLYADHLSHYKKLNQKMIFMLDKRYYLNFLFQHYILPIMLFIALCVFSYVNIDLTFKFLIILVCSVAFLFCLINIQSYFQNKLQTESKTHSIYDTVKLILFFVLVNIELQFYFSFNLNSFFLIVILIITTIIEVWLIFIRNNIYHINTFIYIISSGIIIAVFAIIGIHLLRFTLLQLNLLLFSIYYLLISVINHKLEGTLNFKVISEYIFVILLSMALMYGLQ